MKILLLLVWNGSIFKLITGELVQHHRYSVASNLNDNFDIDETSKDFCAMHNQLINTPMISIDNDFTLSPRCKRDTDSSRDRKSGGLFRNRDNDHNRFENRGRNGRKPNEDRNNDRKPYRSQNDGDRRSFGGRGNDQGANRGPYKHHEGGNRRSFNGGGGDGNRGRNQAPYRGRDGDNQGDRRSYGARGNNQGQNRGPYRGRDGGERGEHRSYGGRGDDRKPFGGRGDNQRSFGRQGEDRRPYGDGGRRSFGNQDGGQRAYRDRGGYQKSFGDGGGNQRSYGDRGGNQRSYGDRGGNQRSYGDRGDNRRSFGDRNDDRKPHRDQNDNRRSYNNRDRGGYGREDRPQRSQDRNNRQPIRNPDTHKQFSRKFTFAEDSLQVVLEKMGKTSKFGGPNVTKFRILRITNKTKKGLDLKGTATMNLDESYFEYSGSAKKKPSKKVTSEYDTDYSIKGANLSPSVETLEENQQAKHKTASDAKTPKQKVNSQSSISEEYSKNDQSTYSEDDESMSYDSETMTDSQDSAENGEPKDSNSEATEISNEYSEGDQPTSYETDSSKQDRSQKLSSELENYDTENDYTEDETPFKQESEYSDEVKTTKQNTKKGQITKLSQKSQHSKQHTTSKLTTLTKDLTAKPSATEHLKTSEQTKTPASKSKDHTTQSIESITKPTTRNLKHRTPKHTTNPSEKNPDSFESETFENDEEFKLLDKDNKDEMWSYYQKRAQKYESFKRPGVLNETFSSLKTNKIKAKVENQDSSTYENSGDYKDSGEYEHDHTGEKLESQEEKECPTHTSPLKNDRYTTTMKPVSSTKSKPIHKASSYENSYKDDYSDENSITYKTVSLKQTSSKSKPFSKTTSKTTLKKGKKIPASDDSQDDEDSYAHDYTQEELGKGKNNAQDQSQNEESTLFYDDSRYPELSENERNKLTSKMEFYKKHVYVFNTKLQDYEFLDASAFKKLNIGQDIAFGNTEHPRAEKKGTKGHGLTKTLNPIIHQQLNMTSIAWSTFTTTVIPSGSRRRFSSRPHPPRKTYYDRSPRSRRIHPPKQHTKH